MENSGPLPTLLLKGLEGKGGDMDIDISKSNPICKASYTDFHIKLT